MFRKVSFRGIIQLCLIQLLILKYRVGYCVINWYIRTLLRLTNTGSKKCLNLLWSLKEGSSGIVWCNQCNLHFWEPFNKFGVES